MIRLRMTTVVEASLRICLQTIWALLLIGATSPVATAQTYPMKPVHIVVPFGPGGTPDLLARGVSDELSKRLGQPFVIENRPGAGGNIGGGMVARAEPDGYQLLMASGSLLTINPSMYGQMMFDPEVAFAPVSLVADMPNVLVVSTRHPARSLRELIESGRREPGMMFFSSPGKGTSPHLTIELFQQAAGIEVHHVAYKSGGEAVTAVLSGEVTGTFANLPLVLSHIKAGSLRALGTASASRLSRLPDVPTMSEAGLPGFESSAWFGLVVPAKTPRAVVDQLSSQVARSLQEPAVQARLAESGVRLVGSSPDEFADLIRRERVKWAQIIRAANIKPD